jgi:hypothetical protein
LPSLRGVARRLVVRSRGRAGWPAALSEQPATILDPRRVREAAQPAGDGAPVEITEWAAFRGVLFVTLRVSDATFRSRIASAVFLFDDCAVELPVPPWRDASASWVVTLPPGQVRPEMDLVLRQDDGALMLFSYPAGEISGRDPYHSVFLDFAARLKGLASGDVLEIGSRARSGNVYRGVVPEHLGYLGLDVKSGPNVDVVGDAHDLSGLFPDRTFAAVFSIAVFEHLAMPWKVAVEINRVLEPGGLLFIGSHQAFPLHEEPWDFWRYSDQAWRGLFNAATGFEILAVAMGEPVALVARALNGATYGMDQSRAFLGSAVLCRKTSATGLDWPVELGQVVPSSYPA